MLNRLPQSPQMELETSIYESPIKVDLHAYLDFCFWMSEELLDLEARFADRPMPEKVMH